MDSSTNGADGPHSSSSSPPSTSSNPLSAIGRMFHGPTKTQQAHAASTPPISPGLAGDRWRFEGPSTSQATGHSSGFKLRAVDINESRTHAVLAGLKTLKTVRLQDDPVDCVESVNICSVVFNHNWPATSHQESSRAIRLPTDPYDLATARSDLFDIEDVAWSNGPHRNKIAAAARTGKIILLDLTHPGLYVTSNFDHLRQVHKLNFSGFEGHYLLSGSQDETVKLWDIRVQRSAMVLRGRSGAVRDVQWSPTDSLSAAFCTDSGSVQHWNLKWPREPLRKISAHEKTCSSISWHPDGKHLASAGHDKTVKTWDLTAELQGRSPPAVSNLRTPYAIANVRWRPACYVRGEDIKHCTQLATSYKEKNSIHVWDLRRPYVPFREPVHRSNTSTTDMLWRSIDLLWTVGPEGDFEQHDIPFTTKVVDRRPPQPFAWSPAGVLTVVTDRPRKIGALDHSKQKQQLRQMAIAAQNEARRPSRSSSIGTPTRDQLLEYGRTPEDDGLDEKFLMANMRRHRSSSSVATAGRRKKTYPGTPPPQTSEELGKLRTESLSTTLALYKPFEPNQTIRSVRIAGVSPDDSFLYLAQNYIYPQNDLTPGRDALTKVFLAIRANAKAAKTAGQHKDARTWELLANLLPKPQKQVSDVSTLPDGADAPGEIASLSLNVDYDSPDTQAKNGNGESTGVLQSTSIGDKRIPESIHRLSVTGNLKEPWAVADISPKAVVLRLLNYYMTTNAQMAVHFYVTIRLVFNLDSEDSTDHGHLNDPIDSHNAAFQAGNIPREQVESVLATYHDLLMRNEEVVAAASLRKATFDDCPNLFDEFYQNNTIGLRCHACKSPVNNPTNKLVCETCGARADNCPFCGMLESPYTLDGEEKAKLPYHLGLMAAGANKYLEQNADLILNTGETQLTTTDGNVDGKEATKTINDVENDIKMIDVEKKSDLTGDSHEERTEISRKEEAPAGQSERGKAESTDIDSTGSQFTSAERLWVACWLCGHSIHIACAVILWADCTDKGSGGKCALDGCYCACQPGSLRDELLEERRAAEQARDQKDKVVGDDKVVGESRAVGRVRGALKDGPSSSKKVRLVTPKMDD